MPQTSHILTLNLDIIDIKKWAKMAFYIITT